MYRHGRFHNRPRHFGPRRFFGGFWVILLILMFFGGRYWPLILVLIGLGIVFSAIFREAPPPPPAPHPMDGPMPPPPAPRMAVPPVEQIHRSELLPTTCTQCGGPIRSYEVKWTGKQSAACPYCGSNLPMKKT